MDYLFLKEDKFVQSLIRKVIEHLDQYLYEIDSEYRYFEEEHPPVFSEVLFLQNFLKSVVK